MPEKHHQIRDGSNMSTSRSDKNMGQMGMTWRWFLIWLVVWLPFFIFPYIGNNHPNWQIFFRGVQTTNQVGFTTFNFLQHILYVLCESLISCDSVRICQTGVDSWWTCDGRMESRIRPAFRLKQSLLLATSEGGTIIRIMCIYISTMGGLAVKSSYILRTWQKNFGVPVLRNQPIVGDLDQR